MDKPNNIMVSVCMITYKHEAYLQEAIEGILNQETEYDYELIISNDCSPDETDAIVEQYIKEHNKGHLIKYFKHSNNIGMMPNFTYALNKCSGKYIALCEGDDYWISSNKLQKQIESLEKNSYYIASFHNVKVVDTLSSSIGLLYSSGRKSEINILDLLNGDYMKTCSLMFKNDKMILQPILSMEIPADDTSLGYCLLLNKSAVYLPEVMAVYRKTEGGVWAYLSEEKRSNWLLNNYKIYHKYYFKNPIMYYGIKNILLTHLKSRIKIQLKKANLKNALYFFIEFLRYKYLNKQ